MIRRRRLVVALSLAAAVLLILAGGAVLLLRSAWFAEQLRLGILAEVERLSGGRAQLGSFRFDWERLEAHLDEFELRGTEPAERPPLFRARSIVVGLRIVSLLRRDVDIGLLALEEPEISIELDEQGRPNLPRLAGPAPPGGPVEPLLRLAIRRLELRRGRFSYLARTIPLDFAARNFRLRALYQPDPPRYLGTLRLDRLHLEKPLAVPVELDSELAFRLEANRLEFGRSRLRSASSVLEFAGGFSSLQPLAARVEFTGSASMAELAGPLGLPLVPAGNIEARGEAVVSQGGYLIRAAAQASGLGFARDRMRLEGIGVTAAVEATPERIAARQVEVRALGGRFDGEATLAAGGGFLLRGTVRSLALERLGTRLLPGKLPWSGLIAGPVSLRGFLRPTGPPELTVAVKLEVQPAGDHPLEGAVELTYDRGRNVLRFGPSRMRTPSSGVELAGTLGERLRVTAATRDLGELAAAAALFSEEVPANLPVRLAGGEARFQGELSGPLKDLHLHGMLAAGPFEYDRVRVDRLQATVDLRPHAARLENVTLRRGRARLEGRLTVGLAGWRPNPQSRLDGSLTVTGLPVEDLIHEAGGQWPVAGILSAAAKVNGTVGAPQLVARLHLGPLTAYEESFDGLDAEVRFGGGRLEILSGKLTAGAGVAGFTASFRPQDGDWRRGQLEFTVNGTAFRLAQWKAVRGARPGLEGVFGWRMAGAVEFGAKSRLTALSGEAYLRNLTFQRNQLGSLRLEAASRDDLLRVRGEAAVKAAKITALAEWSLVGESFGLGEVRFAGLTLDALRALGLLGEADKELPLEGVIDGEVAFTGPVLRPTAWRGMARVSRLEIAPAARIEAARRRDLTLRNAGPVRLAINPGSIAIEQARLVSADSDLSATGTLSFARRNPWNLAVDGTLDLAVLGAVEPDLNAEGRAELSVTVRGSLLAPQLYGRLRFRNASLFHKGFPNGLENASGSLLFDSNRATIEELTAQTGGGDLALSGFVAFGGEEPVYRLQAQAKRVRLRYPADVSTVFDARLELTGSSARSLLSGEVAVQRATFLTGSDIGGILSETARPAARPDLTNPFLRGMSFDIAIVTAGEAEFSTSLTRDIEIEANLRLRGGPARPVLLGRVAINQGEIIFFGNRYAISQGEITFFNPAKIEPVLALDLETKVRGYTVMINFSGPLDQLNFTYRSDPPLQSQEILALLTVGRAPEATRVPGGQAATSQSFLQAGANSLLGQALATPVSSRLQRFFGVSRIKIDPQLTGVDNTPETYITVEQQVSREITLTYVTNLARTQQQIVRIEWNLSRDWSVNAVRDSNGVFGIDFIWRRRF